MSKQVDVSWPEIIESASNLPSLPDVAIRIIRLANDPEATLTQAVELFRQDPAVAGKLLRAVNSAVYAKTRQVESLNQAVVIMGLNASLSLALSFNLVKGMCPSSNQGLHYATYWRKSLLSAVCGRILGEKLGLQQLEELFLTSLLQDIGMLVLDRYDPEFYDGCMDLLADQNKLIAYEQQRLGQDHAYLGALILRKWQLPQRTVVSVLHSHEIGDMAEHPDYAPFAGCVAVSARLADLFLGPDKYNLYRQLLEYSHRYLALGESQVQEIIERVAAVIPEVEALFETQLVSEAQTIEIIQQARELMRHKVAGDLEEISAA